MVYYEKFSDLPYTGEITGEEQGSLRKGLKEGEWVEYYYNGQLESQENFKNGLRNGKSVWYPQQWTFMVEKDFITTTKSKVNRSIITIMDSCKKEELTRMEREGEWVWYQPNGELREKETYKNGEKISN